jgi:hypothetical protein
MKNAIGSWYRETLLYREILLPSDSSKSCPALLRMKQFFLRKE